MKLNELDTNWDLIVIGGGVTGAGIFREAVRMNLKTLIVEQNDFASGTSSRSSKMVHGGLRYLKEGKFLLTRTSVRERERLLKDAPGLVEPLEILVPVYTDRGPGKKALEIGLSIYGLMAHEKQHSYLNQKLFCSLVPDIDEKNLTGGFRFWDAQVDDARLVLRLIQEAVEDGGYALNYTAVSQVNRSLDGIVEGVILEDSETFETKTLSTSAVINATGAWAEKLHPSPKPNLHLRPLRGSHLIFSAQSFPIIHAVSFVHPDDNRPIFATPWEGVVLCGTTDIDHSEDLNLEPFATREEIDYLLNGIKSAFPHLKICDEDCISTIAGVRPVLSEGKLPPSKESRENVIWTDKGLVTVTGGKLTTFRKMAMDSLKTAIPFIGKKITLTPDEVPTFFKPPMEKPSEYPITSGTWRRLCGRYGRRAGEVVETAADRDLEEIPCTKTLWAEIAFAAKNENIRHLSDILLRRVRLGILSRAGGKEFMERIKNLCEPLLSWDDEKWKNEISSYLELTEKFYGIRKE